MAAARAGADAILIVNGVSDLDRYNNPLGFTYFLLITPFFVPGTEANGLFMVSASMWDVRNQYLYLSSEAEGSAKETRPAFFIEESRVIKTAKTDALSALLKELSGRLGNMGAYSTQTGQSVHTKVDSRRVATRGLFFTPDPWV